MARSTLILLFLATTATQVLPSWQLEYKWYPRSWGNMSVLTIDSHLYAVSKNKSHINIQSDDTTYEPCDLELNDTHIGRIQVAGVHSKIVLLYRHNSTSIQMLQLDPFLCLYIPLPSLEASVDSSLEPQLIVVNNTVDIFLNGTRNCLPCRMDVDGNQFEVEGQLTQGNSSLFESYFVEEFVQQELFRNYVFAGNFRNGSSVLMVLDHNFNKTKGIYFKYHLVEALAANSSSNQSWIGITYAGLGSPHERVLALYTGALELLFETRLEKLDAGYNIFDTLLSINSDGHVCVSSMQHISASSSTWYRHMYYVIYNPEGRAYLHRDCNNLRSDLPYDWQLSRRDEGFCCNFYQYQNQYNGLYLTKTSVFCSSGNVLGR